MASSLPVVLQLGLNLPSKVEISNEVQLGVKKFTVPALTDYDIYLIFKKKLQSFHNFLKTAWLDQNW